MNGNQVVLAARLIRMLSVDTVRFNSIHRAIDWLLEALVATVWKGPDWRNFRLDSTDVWITIRAPYEIL